MKATALMPNQTPPSVSIAWTASVRSMANPPMFGSQMRPLSVR